MHNNSKTIESGKLAQLAACQAANRVKLFGLTSGRSVVQTTGCQNGHLLFGYNAFNEALLRRKVRKPLVSAESSRASSISPDGMFQRREMIQSLPIMTKACHPTTAHIMLRRFMPLTIICFLHL